MVELHETFIGAIGTVAVGQLLRRLFMKNGNEKTYMLLLSKILIYVTIPATLFRTMSNVRSMPWDAIYLLLSCLVYECAAAALGALIFCRIDRRYRGVTVGSSVSFAIGMFFFGIMESLAGERGVMYLAFFDVPNAFFVYIGQPLIFHFLSKPEKNKNKKPETVVSAPEDDHDAVELAVSHTPDTDSHHKQLLDGHEKTGDNNEEHESENDVEIIDVEGGHEEKTESKKSSSSSDNEAWSPKKFALRLLGNMSLWGIVIGLILGLTGVKLPVIITNFVNILANGNSCVSYLLIGLYLDVNINTLKRLWRYALMSLGLRYGLGITVGTVLYFTLGTVLTPLARMIVFVSFCTPLPASVTALAAENGADSSLPAFVTNCTFIVSFAVLWAMIAIVGIPVDSSSSLSSSLSSSSLSLPSSL